MTKAFGKIALLGLLGTAAVVGCSDDAKTEDPAPLPTRPGDTRRDGGGGGELDAEAAPTCTNLSLKVSERPACDTCAKEKCCDELLACNESATCKALQECIEQCASDDLPCVLTCQAANQSGSALLEAVGNCAMASCKAECPAEVPDADLGDAF